MRQIFRILGVGRELWRSYLSISILTSLLSISSIIVPYLSGRAIAEIRRGTESDVRLAVWLAVGIFILALSQTLLSNWNGYSGDQVSVKLQNLLSRQYFSHLMTLPQSYFDTELTCKIINRLNRSIAQVTAYIQMMSNNFLQFIFTTILSLIVVAFISWPVALMLFMLYPIFTYMTIRSSGTWQAYQKTKNEHIDIASGRFAEAIGQVKVVKSYVQEKRELSYFAKHFKIVEDTNKPQSAHWHKKDVNRRVILNVIFFCVYLFIFVQGAKGLISPGEAVALILYAMYIRIPIFTISWLVEQT